ncbi:hypothetical protein V6N13_124220 [Hibiscus sabdariffa]
MPKPIGSRMPTNHCSFERGVSSKGSRTSCSRTISSSTPNAQSNFQSVSRHQQTVKKQKRCWSPELHCRFVNALQQLGGSQGEQNVG